MHNPSPLQKGPLPSLFDSETVLSVRTLAAMLRNDVEIKYADIIVEGELSNYKRHSSGHCYFTLKDADAQIRGVMWRHYAEKVFFHPQDGMLVRLRGHVSLYERRGDLQIVTRSMRLAGEGSLMKAFEALKEKLSQEGLFDLSYKKSLPTFPEAIGIVTSGTGAAIRDILSILQRRFPSVRVAVCPVQVQGLGAAEEISTAIEAFNALLPGDPLRPDVLIVGRGGGSTEDLWAFNEEIVARAVFRSSIPTISAVGHETDFTISDYVADVRAATPSMAAELAVPDRSEIEAYVKTLHNQSSEIINNNIRQHRQRIQALTQSYTFQRPLAALKQSRQRLDELISRLHRNAERTVCIEYTRIEGLEHRLQALDPVWPLHRGYVRVEHNNRTVYSATELQSRDAVQLHFHDGKRNATIDDEGR